MEVTVGSVIEKLNKAEVNSTNGGANWDGKSFRIILTGEEIAFVTKLLQSKGEKSLGERLVDNLPKDE